MAVFEQIGAREILGRPQLPVREERGRGDDIGGQLLELRDVRGGGRRVVRLPSHPVQAL